MNLNKLNSEQMTARHVFDAIEYLRNKTFDLALKNIILAFEYGSKIYYPNEKPSARFKKLISKHKNFIYLFSTSGRLRVSGDGRITFRSEKNKNIVGELEDILYKVRNSFIHENSNLPEIYYKDGFGIASIIEGESFTNNKEYFCISYASIMALIIIFCLLEKNSYLSKYIHNASFTINYKKLNLNNYFGTEKFDEIKNYYLHNEPKF